jgi:hypothetical protein
MRISALDLTFSFYETRAPIPPGNNAKIQINLVLPAHIATLWTRSAAASGFACIVWAQFKTTDIAP